MNKGKEVAFLGVFIALALIVGYFERIIPSPVQAIPGIKLGLANVVIIAVLYLRGAREAFVLNIIRVIMSGILFSGISGMLYALSGGLISVILMILFKKSNLFGFIGVSVIGGVSHNIGQIFMAAFIIENYIILNYIPVLVISGIIAGSITGLIAYLFIKKINEIGVYT